VNVRVQGASRSYAAGFAGGGKFRLYKNEKGYRILAETAFPWETGKSYSIEVEVKGPSLRVLVDGRELLAHTDRDNPYLRGCIGLSVFNGSHCAYKGVSIAGFS
jgi:hypothetical protein